MTDNDAATASAADETPDVFLSYSRRDQPFVLRLSSSLEAADWRVWVDTEDIPPASEWRDELASGIRAAHTFVFVLSPDSVESEFCLWELAQAVELGKRLIPLVIREVNVSPEELASRQYVLMRAEDDFEQALETLTTALRTDLEWVREHRHWLMEALRWDSQNRDRSLLVRGRDLKRAEGWLARQTDRTEPRPTPLQTEFLLASRAWQARRIQIVVAAVALALAVSIVLGILALLQRNAARNQAAIARSRELALSSTSQLSVDPQRSLLLAIEAVKARATAEADNALRRAILASRLRAEVPVRAQRIGALVNAVAFSPDGKLVAAAPKGGTVLVASSAARSSHAVGLPVPPPSPGDLCSASSGTEQARIAFSKSGKLIAAVNSQGWIQVWRWPRPREPVTSPFCLGRTTPPSAPDFVSALVNNRSFVPAAVTFATDDVVELVRPDGQILRWSWATGQKPVLLPLSRLPIAAAAFAGAGPEVALADSAGIKTAAPGRRTSSTLPVRGVLAVAVSVDGSRLAAVSGHSITVWRPGVTSRPTVLSAPKTVRSLAMDSRGRFVAIGDNAHAVRVWDLSRGRQAVVLAGSQGAVTAVAFSNDGKRIVSGGDDGVLRIWAWDASRPPSLLGFGSRATRFYLTRDGRLLALGADDGRKAWIAGAGRLRFLEGLVDPTGVSLSRDGRRAASAVAPVESGSVQFWDLARSPQPRTVSMSRRVNSVALSPDGRWLALAEGRRFRVLRWPAKEGRVLGSSERLQYTAAAFSLESRRVAAAGYTGRSSTIFVWDLPRGGASAGRPERFSALGNISSLAFSHDGKKLAAAASDGALRVWDLTGAGPPIVLRGHDGAVNSAAFSPDDNEVVSGGSDGTLRVWELGKGGQAVTIPGPGGSIIDVAFTRDGKEIIAVGTRGARIWSCDFCGPTPDVLAGAQRMTTRPLTFAERALFLHER